MTHLLVTQLGYGENVHIFQDAQGREPLMGDEAGKARVFGIVGIIQCGKGSCEEIAEDNSISRVDAGGDNDLDISSSVHFLTSFPVPLDKYNIPCFREKVKLSKCTKLSL